MKTPLLILQVFVCSFFINLNANASGFKHLKHDSLSCLKLEGKITNADETGSDCIIELISQNGQPDTVVLKEGKTKFRLMLNKNSYYTIRISKPGYLNKLICINTEMITEMNSVYAFEFETHLLKEAALKSLNKDILDFPVAIIYFDYEMECFSYNKEYSTYIKREMYSTQSASVKPAKKGTVPSHDQHTLASARN